MFQSYTAADEYVQFSLWRLEPQHSFISKKHYNIWYCIWGSAAFPKYKVNGKLNHSPSCSTASCQSHSALKSYKVKLANHRTLTRRVWYDSKRLEKKPRRQNEDRHHSQESHSPGDITTEGGRRLKKHHIPELSLTLSLSLSLSPSSVQDASRYLWGETAKRRISQGFHETGSSQASRCSLWLNTSQWTPGQYRPLNQTWVPQRRRWDAHRSGRRGLHWKFEKTSPGNCCVLWWHNC